MEKFNTWLNAWLRRKTGAAADIIILKKELAVCRIKSAISEKEHAKAVQKLNERITELESQDGLARMLDTQRNRTQRQEIADLRREVANLTKNNIELRAHVRRIGG